jgi:hypothetical protein
MGKSGESTIFMVHFLCRKLLVYQRVVHPITNWWLTYPPEKYESAWMIIPTIGENKIPHEFAEHRPTTGCDRFPSQLLVPGTKVMAPPNQVRI